MNRHSWIAVTLFTGIFIASFFIQGHGALFLNGVALLIVTCGTLGALCTCYPSGDLQAALRVTLNLYRNPPPTSEEVINTLLGIALYSRSKGMLALEDISNQSTLTLNVAEIAARDRALGSSGRRGRPFAGRPSRQWRTVFPSTPAVYPVS